MSVIIGKGGRTPHCRVESPVLPASAPSLGVIGANPSVSYASGKGENACTRVTLCTLEKGNLFPHQLDQARGTYPKMFREPSQSLVEKFLKAPP
jgi:hypothetical protein